MGSKYQLAMLCSKPEATNAIIGKKQERIFPVVVSAETANHTAKQTNQLQRIPLQKAMIHPEGKSNPRSAFASDIDTPTLPKEVKFPELPYRPEKNIKRTSKSEPITFPRYTTVQFLNNPEIETFL